MGGDPVLRRMFVCANKLYLGSWGLGTSMPYNTRAALHRARHHEGVQPQDVFPVVQAYRALLDAKRHTPNKEQLFSPPEGVAWKDWAQAQIIAMKHHDIPPPPTADLWDTITYIEEDARRLNGVLETVRVRVKTGLRPVIVLDLDDTLQPTRPRELRIFHEYAQEHGIARLLGMKMGHIVGWDLNHMLVGLMGFHPAWAKVHTPQMRAHWTPRFFSNEYLANDPCFADSDAYVRKLHEAGATIIYVTGRDSIDMREGTVESLRKNNFPVPTLQDLNQQIRTDEQQTLLFMKPVSNRQIVDGITNESERTARIKASDVDYKGTVMDRLAPLEVVASFENEPGNANAFRRRLEGECFLIRTKAANASLPLIEGVQEFRSWRMSPDS